MCNKILKVIGGTWSSLPCHKRMAVILSRYVIGAYLEISAFEHILH
jgi:hypothetical protein